MYSIYATHNQCINNVYKQYRLVICFWEWGDIHVEHITMKTADSGEGWSWAFLGSPGTPKLASFDPCEPYILDKKQIPGRAGGGLPWASWTPWASLRHKQHQHHHTTSRLHTLLWTACFAILPRTEEVLLSFQDRMLPALSVRARPPKWLNCRVVR